MRKFLDTRISIPFFNKNNETKSTGASHFDHTTYLFNTFGTGIIDANISPFTAYSLYNGIGPLKSTVGKISGGVGDLPLCLRLESEPDTIIKDSEIIDLLKNPSPLTTSKQFIGDIAVSALITNEIYIVARGNVKSKPLELVFIHAYNVQIIEDADSIWPVEIYTNINGDRRFYYREEVNGRYRYFDKTGYNEIFPYIHERNVSSNTSNFRGISKLGSIKDELLSYKSSVVANKSFIDNSSRPSGIVSLDDNTITDEQYKDLKESLKEENTGALNSGKIVLVPAKVSATFPQWAPKDMDNENLQKNVKLNIWNIFSMPLPVVSPEGQKFSNFEIAQLAFYDEAIDEAWSIVSDALKWMLETRFDMSNLSISYNDLEVPALRRRAIRNTKDMKDSEVFSTNEIRQSVGVDDEPNGDDILVSSNKTTLSSVVSAADYTSSLNSKSSGD